MKRTFFLHAELEALFESAVLALVAVMLVDRTVVVAATRVRQVTTDRALEEALAAFTRHYAVMFARTLVAAYNTLEAGAAADQRVAVQSSRLSVMHARRRRNVAVCDGGERWRTDACCVHVVVVVVGGACSRVSSGLDARPRSSTSSSSSQL